MMPIDVPLEVQLEVFRHLAHQSPATLASVARLSKTHNRLVTPILYAYIAARNRNALAALARTLQHRPSLKKHVRSFFFRGPQARRVTGDDALTLLTDDDDGDDEGRRHDDELRVTKLELEEINEMRRLGLEPGLEGEGQDTTWDEHEAAMQLCTSILRACASTLECIGFVDCVPWFLAPAEGGTLNFPLPACHDFTGVTVGLFGLLPHLQRNGQQVDERATSLRRVHLIGGDFGSFALQKALLTSPSVRSLIHLHITAPSLYRTEHHAHLVAHIKNLLDNLPHLKRLSVGILQWQPPPPPKMTKSDEKRTTMAIGKGKDDDRLIRTREAYAFAMPEALEGSKRSDVRVALIKLPFAQASPAGFGGWVMKHHRAFINDRSCVDITYADAYRKVWMYLWTRRDLSRLPPTLSLDGAPAASVWDITPSIEWCFSEEKGVAVCRGSVGEW